MRDMQITFFEVQEWERDLLRLAFPQAELVKEKLIPQNAAHTKHIINKENILTFKKGSYLINTARRGLIETEAIVLGRGSLMEWRSTSLRKRKNWGRRR